MMKNMVSRMDSARILFPALAAGLLALCGPRASGAPAGWWNDAWACRKTIEVGAEPRLDKDDAAVVAFTTCGNLSPEASDLRVIDAAGKIVPHYVIASGFEDLCTVAFPVSSEAATFYLYYGNPSA
ncbi:MAG: hypothetical protein JXR94_08150, partial [Candidatus Hydrogenedentes bacterium]|nr:hypothetical protein [Candidatus Hydrogenedentota bacterium]